MRTRRASNSTSVSLFRGAAASDDEELAEAVEEVLPEAEAEEADED